MLKCNLNKSIGYVEVSSHDKIYQICEVEFSKSEIILKTFSSNFINILD